MTPAPLLATSASIIIFAGLISLYLFYLSVRSKRDFYDAIFRQWSLAFFLFTWVRVPVFLASLGVTLTVSKFGPAFAIASTASIIAYILFYRGAILVFTKNKFLVNVVPILMFVFMISSILTLQFLFNAHAVDIMSFAFIFEYSIIIFMILLRIKFLRKSFPLLDYRTVTGSILIMLGWILFLIFSTLHWQTFSNYPKDFWFFALLSSPAVYAYAGLAVAHIFLLVGFIITNYKINLPRLKR